MRKYFEYFFSARYKLQKSIFIIGLFFSALITAKKILEQ